MEMMGALALFISVVISGCATSRNDESELSSIREKDPNQLSLSKRTVFLEISNLIVPKAYVAKEDSKIVANILMETESSIYQSEVTNSIGMKLVWIPAGEFDMGSAEGEPDEKPVHRVQILEFVEFVTLVIVALKSL